MDGFSRAGGGSFQGRSQHLRIGQRYAQDRSENASLVPSMPVVWVEGVVLDFRPHVRPFTVG